MIAIGGVGGSGTRVVAEVLKKIGYFIGDDLNISNDNLLFTLLFKRENILTLSEREFDKVLNIFLKIMNSNKILTQDEMNTIEELAQKDRTLHNKVWLRDRVKNIKRGRKYKLLAWKEPNTHIIVEKLLKKIDNLKFIYVYRNGLDMAFSSNQNQLKLWGSIFLNDKNIDINPQNSLKYWCLVHQRMINLQKENPNNILMLDFDILCKNPKKSLVKLLNFIEIDNDIDELIELIKIPSSIGRYREFSLKKFDKEDLEYINSFYNLG